MSDKTCGTCIYGFPAGTLEDMTTVYECGVTAKPLKNIVIECGWYVPSTRGHRPYKFPKVTERKEERNDTAS